MVSATRPSKSTRRWGWGFAPALIPQKSWRCQAKYHHIWNFGFLALCRILGLSGEAAPLGKQWLWVECSWHGFSRVRTWSTLFFQDCFFSCVADVPMVLHGVVYSPFENSLWSSIADMRTTFVHLRLDKTWFCLFAFLGFLGHTLKSSSFITALMYLSWWCWLGHKQGN